MSQIGGESIRLGIIVNEKTVLESFTSRLDGKVKTILIPINNYIQEEFCDYGTCIDVENKIRNSKEILPIGSCIAEVYSDENVNISRSNTGRVFISTNDGIEII